MATKPLIAISAGVVLSGHLFLGGCASQLAAAGAALQLSTSERSAAELSAQNDDSTPLLDNPSNQRERPFWQTAILGTLDITGKALEVLIPAVGPRIAEHVGRAWAEQHVNQSRIKLIDEKCREAARRRDAGYGNCVGLYAGGLPSVPQADDPIPVDLER